MYGDCKHVPDVEPVARREYADRVALHQRDLTAGVPKPHPAAAVRRDDAGDCTTQRLARLEPLPAAADTSAVHAVIHHRHPEAVATVARDCVNLLADWLPRGE